MPGNWPEDEHSPRFLHKLSELTLKYSSPKYRRFFSTASLGDLLALTRQKPQASRKAQTLVNHELEICPPFFFGS